MTLVHKFRKDPVGFFRDSHSRFSRKILAPIFDPLSRINVFRDLLEDPCLFLDDVGLWRLKDVFERRNRNDRSSDLERAGYPKVSVIVAAYNAEGTIGKSIASIQGQDYRSIEIIIVNDASTDRTAEIATSLAETDARIRVLHTTENRGAAYCRNIGLTVADGEFVTFQDADDVSLPERIGLQLHRLLEAGGVGVSVCNYVRVDAQGNRLTLDDKRVRKCVISMMFPRQKALEGVGYFRELPVGEDTDYLERLRIFLGKKGEIYLFRTLYKALLHNTSTMMQHGETTRSGRYKLRYRRTHRAEAIWQKIIADHESMRNGLMSTYQPFSHD